MHSNRSFNTIPWQAEVDDTETEDDDEMEQKTTVKIEEGITPSIPCVVLQHPVAYAPPSLSVTLATLKHMFSKKNVWERAHVFTCGVLQIPLDKPRTVQTHPLYKGFRKQLYSLLRKEYNLIKGNIRLLQRRRPVSNKPQRPRKPRPLSKYAVFCRELRVTKPHQEICGKMQQLWKLKKQEIERERHQSIAGKRPSVYGLKRPFQPHRDEYASDTSIDSEMEDDN